MRAKIIVLLLIVLASTVFTRRSNEYQILLEKPSSSASSLHIQLENTCMVMSQLESIELTQILDRVSRRGPTGGTSFIFPPFFHTIECCPNYFPLHQCLPHHCCCRLCTALLLTFPTIPPPPPPLFKSHLSLCRTESTFFVIP